MIIDCDGCAVRGQACGDCVVGVLLGVPGGAAGESGPVPVRLEAPERRALAVLAEQGLVPRLRLAADPRRDPHSGSAEAPRAAG